MKVIVILFLFSLTTLAKVVYWDPDQMHDSLLWNLRNEILKFHQLEKMGHEVKCNATMKPILHDGIFFTTFNRDLYEIDCEDGSYEPPTLDDAERILNMNPDLREPFAKKRRQRVFSDQFLPAVKQVILALWNKTEPVTWDDIVDRMVN